MKNAVYLFITIIFLSSCQKEESIELSQTVEPVGNRKLSLITLKWGDKYNNPPTLGSIYYKIT